MIGFAPGFAYLGGLDSRMQVSRHPEARRRTPAGSVSIGGIQTAISSLEAPSAWQLIGRTPVRLFDRRRPDPVLLRAGDLVRLEAITSDEFARLDRACAEGALGARLEEA
jgi:KipI family sensor histidine kinase inhibitor